MAQEDNRNYREDEIDLRKLFNSIGQWFINLWFWIIGLVISFRNITLKYKYLLIGAIVLTIGYSFFITRTSTPYYTGSLIINSKYLNQKVSQNIVDILNNLNSNSLSDTLKLDTTITKDVINFSVEVLNEEEERLALERLADKLNESNFDAGYKRVLLEQIESQIYSYEFRISTKNNESLKDLIDATADYCLRFPYIQDRIIVNRRALELKKEKLRSESQKLDSLKTFIVKNIETMGDRASQGSNNVILADDVNANPLNVFQQDLLLYDEELEIDKQLALREDFQVYEGSFQQTTPASPSFMDNLKKWLLYIIGGAYGIIFLIQINKYLNKVEQDNIKTQTNS